VATSSISSDSCVAADVEEWVIHERRRTGGYFDEVGVASPLARRRRRLRCDAGKCARSDLGE
jgi:hypothetical protein